MGLLTYPGRAVEIDDRLLTHLHIVIVQKLRVSPGFAMSWMNALSDGDGRSSIWLHPALPLIFDFSGSRPPSINRDWLETLRASADSSTGLVLTGEDGQLVRCARRH